MSKRCDILNVAMAPFLAAGTSFDGTASPRLPASSWPSLTEDLFELRRQTNVGLRMPRLEMADRRANVLVSHSRRTRNTTAVVAQYHHVNTTIESCRQQSNSRANRPQWTSADQFCQTVRDGSRSTQPMDSHTFSRGHQTASSQTMVVAAGDCLLAPCDPSLAFPY